MDSGLSSAAPGWVKAGLGSVLSPHPALTYARSPIPEGIQLAMATPRSVLLALLCVAIPITAHANRMFTATGYIVGLPSFPRHAELADLNGDGVADIVVGLATGKGLSTALATGGGSFAPFVTRFPGRRELFIAMVDVDGDGRLDAAGTAFDSPTHDSSSAFVAYGDGNGGWIDSFEVRIPRLERAAFGDLDGDGRADMVASLLDSTIVVYHSNANRTLTALGTYAAAGQGSKGLFADLVGSSAIDFLLPYAGDFLGVSVFEGNGDGTLGPRTDASLGGSWDLVCVASIDAQPGPDLVVSFPDIKFSSGAGGGGFSPPTELPGAGVPVPMTYRASVVRDFNGDGNLDVASGYQGSNSRGIASWLGDGAGGFSARLLTGQSMFAPIDLADGDVDGDGKLDLAYTGAFTGNLILSLGQQDGTFGQRQTIPQITGSIASLATGDFDGDGSVDLLGGDILKPQLAFARGHGDGTFDTLALTGAMPLGYLKLLAGRFDGDANLDLVGLPSNNAPNVSFLKGHGDGTFDAAVNLSLGVFPGSSLSAVDLNGDGKLDLAVPCAGANAIAILMQGAGGLTAAAASPTLTGPLFVRYADLNADGRLDRVVSASNQWGVQLDDGLGGYTTLAPHAQSPTPGDIALADLDEDGLLDIAITQGAVPGVVHIWRGQAGGAFDSEALADFDWLPDPGASNQPNPAQLEARDFDDDGHVDLIARDGSNASFAIEARGRGDRTFERAEAYALPYTATVLVAEDFNGDGRVDLAGTGGTGTPKIASIDVLLNRSGGVVGVPARPAPGRTELAISSIVPNPSRGAFALELQSARAGTARLAVMTLAGRVVIERTGIALVPGANRVVLDPGRALAPGVYWVRAMVGLEAAARKVVVLP